MLRAAGYVEVDQSEVDQWIHCCDVFSCCSAERATANREHTGNDCCLAFCARTAGLNRTGTEKQKHTGLDKGVTNGQTYFVGDNDEAGAAIIIYLLPAGSSATVLP